MTLIPLAVSLATLVWCFFYVKSVLNNLYGVISSMSLEVTHLKDWRDAATATDIYLSDEIDKLKEQIEKLPKEDLQAKYDAEKAWNDGVQAILNYGLETVKGDNNV